MMPERVALGKKRVLEIVVGECVMPICLHDASGPVVRRHGEGDDLVQRKLVKSEVERGTGAPRWHSRGPSARARAASQSPRRA